MNSNIRQKFLTGAMVLLVTVCVIPGFAGAFTQAFADNGYKGKNKQKEWQKQKGQDKEYRKHPGEIKREGRKHYEEQGRRDYKKRSGYNEHRGYRERPYDNRRHYKHQDYKGHRYDYHGHWRSWDQWNMYAKKHPQIYKHGTYYRENAHLMFRFCEPGTGNYFFFSIGR